MTETPCTWITMYLTCKFLSITLFWQCTAVFGWMDASKSELSTVCFMFLHFFGSLQHQNCAFYHKKKRKKRKPLLKKGACHLTWVVSAAVLPTSFCINPKTQWDDAKCGSEVFVGGDLLLSLGWRWETISNVDHTHVLYTLKMVLDCIYFNSLEFLNWTHDLYEKQTTEWTDFRFVHCKSNILS